LPSKLSIKKPCQYFYRSCQTADTPAATLREFGKAPADVNAIPSKVLSPTAKLVFYALAAKACGTDRKVWMSDGAIALRCGVSRPSVVAGLRQLLELGLVERVGLPVNQIQAYRICHPMFGAAGSRDSGASDSPKKASEASIIWCAKCRRPCKRLTRAAHCRGCSADIELTRQIREVWAENPGISAEELANKIKDRAQLKRLTARVRRVLQEAASSGLSPISELLPPGANCAEVEKPAAAGAGRARGEGFDATG
jgi:DNA-binding transcriptional ArsR family regulator